MAAKKELTTTSFAVLGWLAVKPWPMYELAKQTQRNLRYFWPRADSRLYEEPKKLVAHGLATVERTFVGKRPRTIYAITPKGRAALKKWLGQPSAPPSLDFEALVRVFFAETGTRDQMLDALSAADRLADDIQATGEVVATEFLEGGHPFPDRMHLSGIVFDFLWSWADLLRDWAERSRAEVSGWDGVRADPSKAKRAARVFSRAVRPRR